MFVIRAVCIVALAGSLAVAAPAQTPRPVLRTVGGHATAVALRNKAKLLEDQAARDSAAAVRLRRHAAMIHRAMDRLHRELDQETVKAGPKTERSMQLEALIATNQGVLARELGAAQTDDANAARLSAQAKRLLVQAAIADTRP